MKSTLRLLALLTVVSTSAFAGWTTDYPAATAAASKDGQMTLVLFTGKDWCPPCKMLERETLSKSDFLTYAEKNLQLVELDFPRSKEPSAENMKLSEKFGIEGFPTLVLLDSKGKELARNVGFLPGGPEALIAWIKKESK